MKIALPWKEINAEMTTTLSRDNVETIIKWYLEQLHGKTVKNITYKWGDSGQYQMTISMPEKIRPVAEVNDNKQADKPAQAAEIDINL